ncbi:hypothetical protein LUZ60_017296 [Juncus effusus]|nr:hypothetical protein LUZ60_017296 [Juncus effusus]
MSRRLFRQLRPLLCSVKNCSSLLIPSVSSYSCSSSPSALGFSHKPHDFFALSPFSRSFASSGGSNSNIVIVGSADGFKSLLKKAQDEKLPSIFYFTATWCGPCRAISPVIEKLSAKYPNVTIYKVDIDQEGLGSILNELKIYSVPTFHFHQNGERASEVIGADVRLLESTMENLYK